ncbi:hypothetical protein [Nocardia sp. XZ_19_385]|uniref:hypothetical protein n=1 Tax=Nocardia sp. XZ_19_385 TaxID=2769488 RepID=UPI00188DF0BC|nr:hypothetical protein [Nocardia sp. XZ_19_385]
MRFQRSATVLLGATLTLPLLVGFPATATADPVVGGCYGGQLTTTNVPGSGSGGMDTNVTGGLTDCGSPQLPEVDGGMLNISYPFNIVTGSNSGTGAGGNPAGGTIVWSDGSVSVVSGNWVTSPVGQNAVSTLGVLSGPGAGQQIVFGTRQIANSGSVGGGSGGAGSVMVIDALFH